MVIENCKDAKLLGKMRHTLACQIDRIIDNRLSGGDPESVRELLIETRKIDQRLEELGCFNVQE